MSTNLSTRQFGVRRQVEDVLNELRDSIPSDPEEDVLTILDEEETVSLESFARQVHRRREY